VAWDVLKQESEATGMRILIAAGESQSIQAASGDFRNFGAVDTVQDGREAVLAYINASQTGNPYHIVFIGYDLPNIAEAEVLDMLWYYDQEHHRLAGGLVVCCVSTDSQWEKQHQARFGNDTRVHFYSEPASAFALTSLVKITANELGEFKPKMIVRRHPSGGIYA
jgi:hypothetical protein